MLPIDISGHTSLNPVARSLAMQEVLCMRRQHKGQEKLA